MISPLLIDAVLLAVIALFCFLGYKRGLMLSIFSAGSSIVSFILSILLYPVVSSALRASPVFNAIRGPVHDYVLKIASGVQTANTREVVDAMALPDVIKENILGQVGKSGAPVISNLADSITNIVTGLIIDMIAIVILFIIIKIGLLLLKKVLKGVGSIPVIKQVDQIGGVAFGLLEAFVILTVVGALFSYFSPNLNAEAFIKAINDSFIGNYFYNNNLLLNIISGKPLKY